ncbi:MAG: hypothetical protein IPH07_08355 [Deltaproteobacteria bacterium]|nr:hypothetical protein [Deltaproteobacteria bacterium]MBK8236751.1 hypothetical protein [Deltaproteobacteria bacterium]MBK8720045.1 hypothetical protein [Deltaproteobacteria bacterium]MBP7289402.1 hypothetical protein [Nannocystaceae bacterium]
MTRALARSLRPLSHRVGRLHRVAALLVGLASVPMAVPVAAAAPVDNPTARRARALQIDGQARFEQQLFEQAGDVWSRIFEVLPENPVNREERGTTLLICLEAYREAYRVHRESKANDGLERGIAMLRKGVGLLDRYLAAFARQYGDTAQPSPTVEEKGRELRELLAAAERELTPVTAPPPNLVGPPQTGLQPDTGPGGGPNGKGLIAGGSVVMALGLGASAMIIVGALRAKDAKSEQQRAKADGDTDALRAADRKGTGANGLIIGGAVATGVLLAAGATMLGIGLRRHARYQAFVPVVGPQYVGIGLSGRF